MLFPIFTEAFFNCAPPGGENVCARQVGWLNSANSVGAIGGGFLVLAAARVQRKGVMVLWATLAYSLLLFAFATNRDLYLGLLIVGGLGLADAITMVMRQTIVQLTTPDNLLGRASSAHSFAAMGANNVGQMEVAFMSKWIGAGPTMLIGGSVATAVTLLIWWGLAGIRKYRYVEGQAIPPAPVPAQAAPPVSGASPPQAAKPGGGRARTP
jgi:MFS family permease